MSAAGRRTWTAIGLATATAMAAAAAPPATGNSIVAPGPNGTAHLAWTDYASSPASIQHRRLLANGTLGSTQAVSSPARDSVGQEIGVDAAGNAHLAWLSPKGDEQLVQMRRRSPNGALSAVQTLSPPGVFAYGLQLAVEPDGDAVAVWGRSIGTKYVIQARQRKADGTLGAIHTLSYAGATSTEADVAIAPTGAATVVWLRHTGGTPNRPYVQTRTIAGNGTLSETQSLSPTTSSVIAPVVAVSDAGVATIAWVRSVEGVGPGIYRLRSAQGSLGPPVEFASSIALNHLSLAGDGAGRTVFAWLKDDAAGDDTKARIRTPGNGLGYPFDVGGSGVQTYKPEVGMDADGNPTFAWHETVNGHRRIHVRRRGPAGWGELRAVSHAQRQAGPPNLAVDAAGKATVAWFDEAGLWARTVTANGTVGASILDVRGP